MGYRIFLAGAAGAVGLRLIPQLLASGHRVTGTTRQAARADQLRALGVEPLVVDVFDADALSLAMASAKPDIVIHQLTDLPAGLDPNRMGEAIVRNARIRDEGTRNLVRAAIAAGARRMIAQSIAWAYAPGREPHAETDPLDSNAEGDRGISMAGVIALEKWVLGSPSLVGVVLRYGQLYGPGTGREAPAGSAPLHVDAAAHAAALAVGSNASGAFNVAEANTYVLTERVTGELGWSAGYRLSARR